MLDLAGAIEHHPDSKPFWQGLGLGKFLLKFCKSCERAHWYPRSICPHCSSPDTEWREASGRGSIYSWSVSRTVAEPYAIAYVRLAEGPTMMSRLVDCDLDAIAIGNSVAVSIGQADDGTPLPFFKLT